jgi:hypothetical protein
VGGTAPITVGEPKRPALPKKTAAAGNPQPPRVADSSRAAAPQHVATQPGVNDGAAALQAREAWQAKVASLQRELSEAPFGEISRVWDEKAANLQDVQFLTKQLIDAGFEHPEMPGDELQALGEGDLTDAFKEQAESLGQSETYGKLEAARTRKTALEARYEALRQADDDAVETVEDKFFELAIAKSEVRKADARLGRLDIEAP